MITKQKMLVMTKLALYDKHEGQTDREINEYFRHDYIYRKNLGNRIAVGIGGLIMLGFYWLNIVYTAENFFDIQFETHITNSVLFLAALMVFYTFVGTIKGTREYYMVQRRLEKYERMINHLDRMEEHAKRREAAASAEESDPERNEVPIPRPRPSVRTSKSPEAVSKTISETRPRMSLAQAEALKRRESLAKLRRAGREASEANLRNHNPSFSIYDENEHGDIRPGTRPGGRPGGSSTRDTSALVRRK